MKESLSRSLVRCLLFHYCWWEWNSGSFIGRVGTVPVSFTPNYLLWFLSVKLTNAHWYNAVGKTVWPPCALCTMTLAVDLTWNRLMAHQALAWCLCASESLFSSLLPDWSSGILFKHLALNCYFWFLFSDYVMRDFVMEKRIKHRFEGAIVYPFNKGSCEMATSCCLGVLCLLTCSLISSV